MRRCYLMLSSRSSYLLPFCPLAQCSCLLWFKWAPRLHHRTPRCTVRKDSSYSRKTGVSRARWPVAAPPDRTYCPLLWCSLPGIRSSSCTDRSTGTDGKSSPGSLCQTLARSSASHGSSSLLMCGNAPILLYPIAVAALFNHGRGKFWSCSPLRSWGQLSDWRMAFLRQPLTAEKFCRRQNHQWWWSCTACRKPTWTEKLTRKDLWPIAPPLPSRIRSQTSADSSARTCFTPFLFDCAS